MTTTTTHEQFLSGVRDIVVTLAVAADQIDTEQAKRLINAKLVYGVGAAGTRGTCYYEAWNNGSGTVEVIEVAAAGEESWVQLAGTTVHELAHVLAGHGAGHGNEWKDLAVKLGFIKRPEAAGQRYHLVMLRPELRLKVYELAQVIADGSPAFRTSGIDFGALMKLVTGAPRPCSAGVGSRGGTSRGKGSGSRLRLYECECSKPVKVRVASDNFQAHCDLCGEPFTKREKT